MQPLNIQAPPNLAETLGYDGPNRFVGFFWEPAGDEFCWDDGNLMTTNGCWYAWVTFTDHEYMMPHLHVSGIGIRISTWPPSFSLPS